MNGYGSIPINTIFSGMNIHVPAILMFTRGTRFWHTAESLHFRKPMFRQPMCWMLMDSVGESSVAIFLSTWVANSPFRLLLLLRSIWVCLKIKYTPCMATSIGNMMTNHQNLGYIIFRRTHFSKKAQEKAWKKSVITKVCHIASRGSGTFLKVLGPRTPGRGSREGEPKVCSICSCFENLT